MSHQARESTAIWEEDGSASPASNASATSDGTIKPGSPANEAALSSNTTYFEHEFYLDLTSARQEARYHVYLSPPKDPAKGPLFICHHGAGASGLSFAILAQELRKKLPHAGILSLDARGHGSVVADLAGNEIADFSLATLATDAIEMIKLTQQYMSWPSIPPAILVGHSLGGAVVTQLACDYALGSAFLGYCVIDVVEGSALEALQHMRTYLSSRPSVFDSIPEAIDWHLRTRTLRSRESAEASVPSLLNLLPSGKLVWKAPLSATAPWWEEWFKGMSQKFLKGRGAKLLVLAGTDRMDKDLMIGQMQGKFQLVVMPEAGHFVQEDAPERLAEVLIEFFQRNDRSTFVMPMKVSEMLRLGKKV